MKELWEMLIPLVFNNGEPITDDYHEKWYQKVRDLAGGLTIYPIAVEGQWVNPNTHNLYIERMVPVRIACDYATIHKIADLTVEHYAQEVVMFYKVSDKVFFHPARP